MSKRWERIANFKLQHEPQGFVRKEKAFKYVSMCLKQSHQELEVHKDRAHYLYLQFHVCQARYIQVLSSKNYMRNIQNPFLVVDVS